MFLFRTRRGLRSKQSTQRRFGKSRLWVRPLEERAVPANLTVTSALDDGSAGTLRSVLATANTNGQDDVITFDPAVTTVNLTGGELAYSEAKQLTITGNGSDTAKLNFSAINASANSRIFNLAVSGAQPTITFNNMMLTKGAPATGNGGAILDADETLVLSNVALAGNKTGAAATNGGAIATGTTATVLTLSGCTVSGNSAVTGGGGIFLGGPATVTINSSSVFTSNSAGLTGGALHAAGTSSLTINSSTFSFNSGGSATTGIGGAVQLVGASTVGLTQAKFDTNSAGGTGGAINAAGATVFTITNSAFTSNSVGAATTSVGGAINVAGAATVTMNQATFDKNVSSGHGGAVNFVSSVTFTTFPTIGADNSFTGNRAVLSGGAIRLASASSTASFDRSIFAGNSVTGSASTTFGGAIAFASGGLLTVNNSSIYNNTAGGVGGGGISVSTAAVVIANSTLSGNAAAGNSTVAVSGGGAILVQSTPNLTIRNSTIANNTAALSGVTSKGGGIFTVSSLGSVNLNSVIVAGNFSPQNAVSPDISSNAVPRTVNGKDNLIGVHDVATITLPDGANIVNTPARLFPLSSTYGGPTPTHALIYNSPALNMGSNIAPALTTDQRGLPRESPAGSPDIGAVEGIWTDPFFVSHTLTDVAVGGGGSYAFTVDYEDETGIDTTSLGAGDLSITGPTTITAIAFAGASTVGKVTTASYTFTPPGGTWDAIDSGKYSVNIVAGQVTDLDGTPHSVLNQAVGTFLVTVSGILTVDNVGDAIDGNLDAGQVTLREALATSNFTAGSQDTINFAAAIDNQTINLTAGELVVSDSVVIQGSGSNKTLVSAAAAASATNRIFNLNIAGSSASITINGMTLSNGNLSTGNGAAIVVADEQIMLTDVVFSNNKTNANGGAIATSAANAAITLINCVFTGNSAAAGGGAIHEASTTTFTATGCSFIGNTAVTVGGGINLFPQTAGTTVTFDSCTFTNNLSGGNGGAVSSQSGSMRIMVSNSTFTGNTATGGVGGGIFCGGASTTTFTDNVFVNNTGTTGGALYASSQLSMTVSNCQFMGNSASSTGSNSGGGAIRLGGGTMTFNSSLFTGNLAADQGGAMSCTTGPFLVTINDSTITNNSAGSIGGGVVCNANGTTATVTNSVFANNRGSSGGAFYAITTLNLSFTGVQFLNNTATTSSGGAIRDGGGTIMFDSCTFNGNFATTNGGAVDGTSGPFTYLVSNTTFSHNTATRSGGAMCIETGVGSITATNSTFDHNFALEASATASQGGGAIQVTTAGSSIVATGCTFDANFGTNGGALAAAGITGFISATSCVFTNNSALTGGAIFANLTSSVTVDKSTLSGNTATSIYSGGGAIALYAGAGMITNSTISGNTSNGRGGSAIGLLSPSWSGPLEIRSTTITNNVTTKGDIGGAIAGLNTGGSLNLYSTILASNIGTPARDFGFTTQIFIGGNDNLIGAVDPLEVMLTGINDPLLIGTEASPVDPGLYPLANNGGPSKTHALKPGSKAIDHGNNDGFLTSDQRGNDVLYPRVVNLVADIGAVEGAPIAPVVLTSPANVAVTDTQYVVTVNYEDETGIALASIDTTDLQITGKGFGAPATPFKVETTGSGMKVTANYYFTAPGGGWTAAHNGLYTVALVGTVLDTDATPHAAAMGNIGQFTVGISRSIVVNYATDEDDGNYSAGDLSLREAIRLQHEAPGFADSITFDKSVFGGPQTITMTLGELRIADSVSIIGPGANLLAIDAGLQSRHFRIDGDGYLTVSMSGMTLASGSVIGAGGSILNVNENVTLSNMLISNNNATTHGGAVENLGVSARLAVVDSNISNNSANWGGGINADNAASIFITRSTISGNSATVDGGGVYFFDGGSLNIDSSTLSENTSNASGSATIGGSGGGGGVYFYGQVEADGFNIINSTISGNRSLLSRGGGIALHKFIGNAVIRNSTLTGNDAAIGGGISNTRASAVIAPAVPGTITLHSTIAAGNTVSVLGNEYTADLWNESTANIAGDYNLIGIADLSNNITLTGVGNKMGDLITPLDAKLGPLADNGGSTKTHALLTGSPAIDAGQNSAAYSFDQRGTGFVRTYNDPLITNVTDGTDIGAFEAQPTVAPAKFANLVINNAAVQRSRVTTLKVTFDSSVTINGPIGAAFQLRRVSDNASVTLNGVLDGTGTNVTLTFTGGAVDGKAGNFSLIDGRYTLTILAGQFGGTGFDGNGDGTAGDNYVTESKANTPPSTPPTGIFRLFGDIDGNGQVNGADFLQFRLSFLQNNDAFDFDGSGSVDGADFLQFRLRFLQSIT